MEGCKYCDKFEKTWNKLIDNHKEIKMIKINGPKNKRMNKKYDVESYPTIILIDKGEHEIFEVKRTYKKLKEFISN